MVFVLLSASVDRFSVSCMRDSYIKMAIQCEQGGDNIEQNYLFTFIHFCLLRYTWFPLSSLGFTLVLLGSLGQFGFTLFHLVSICFTWFCVCFTLVQLGSLGVNWGYLGLLWFAWVYLGSHGFLWVRLGSLGNKYSHIGDTGS